MPLILSASARQTNLGPGFNSRNPPMVDQSVHKKQLVSKLKRLITITDKTANEASMRNESQRVVNLRIARSFASEKLDRVVSNKTRHHLVENELKDAIRVLEDALKSP